MTKAHRQVEVGCQGWNYDDWITGPASGDRVFYPQGTRAAEMLEVYARAFGTVEVDSTFYAIPSAQTLDGWKRRTPPSFTFSLKLPQEITHQRALRDGSPELLAEFCDRLQLIEDRLAAILVQLPPHFLATPENVRALRSFLARLPRQLRFGIEFRSADWLKAEGLADLLANHNVSIALVEGPWLEREAVRQLAERPTADFAYIRWMGARNLTRFDRIQRPQDHNLRDWTSIIEGLRRRVSHIYAYFSNFYEGHAPASANKLKRLLGQPVREAADLEDQPSLF